MTYEEKKNMRIKKRKIRNAIIVSIFCLLLARSAYGIIANNPKTTLPKDEDYIISMKAQGVLIMDENVYEIDGNIELNPNIQEGKRLSQGYEIGRSDIAKDLSIIKEELEEIDRAIETLEAKNNESSLFTNDKETLEFSQEALIEKIQKRINEKNYGEVIHLKNQILFYDDKLSDLSMDNTLLSQSLESLKARKTTIIDEINTNSLNYYSQESGVISFEIDGFENLFLAKEFENYTYDKLEIEDSNKNKSGEEVDKPIDKFKIINNFNWYLAIKIDNVKDMKSYEIGDSINLTIEDNDRGLIGSIIAINESGARAVYIVKFNSYLYDYYNIRFPATDILLKKEAAYLIPTKSIIENDGQKGVYIKEFNGIVRFRPVEILDQKEDFTFISKGDQSRYIYKDSDEPVRTISLYDEIIINPHSFNDGDIIN